MAEIGIDVKYAAKLLRKGKLVAIPTETVYGLAANAMDEDAVVKIFEAKNRPRFNPLILHVSSVDKIELYAKLFFPLAKKLAEKFMPGPLTLLLPKKEIVSDLVTSGNSTVAIRVPNHKLTIDLLNEINFPLVAPSANPFGYVSPTSAEHVQKQLGNKIEYILDGGECAVGIESTIVGFDENGNPAMYRQGGISEEEIEKICGIKVLKIISEENSPSVPGMLKSHYSPETNFIIGNIDELIKLYSDKKIGILSFDKSHLASNSIMSLVLSEKSNLNEAAKNLFSFLRILDEANLDVILAEYVPDKGIGKAINDRLKRAAEKN